MRRIRMSHTDWVLAIGCSLLSATLGALYAAHAFGPTEAEVVTWGHVNLLVGAALAVHTWVNRLSTQGIFRGVSTALLGTLACLQVLPTALWIIFHGSGISDGTPASSFVAHWGMALPHATLLILSVTAIIRLHNQPAMNTGSFSPNRAKR